MKFIFSLVALALAVGIGSAWGAARRGQRTMVTIGPGTFLHIRGVDLGCNITYSDPDHNDPGPAMYCERWSTNRANSAAMGVSRFHYRLSRSYSRYWNFSITRSP